MLGLTGVLSTLNAESETRLLRWMKRSNAVYSPHEAAASGSAERMAQAIKDEPMQVNTSDELGQTPLHIAARAGAVDCVRILIEAGADASARDAEGKLPIDVCRGDEVHQLLLKAGEARAKELDLCRAIVAGNRQAVQAALAEGVNPNAYSEDKRGSLLREAVMHRHSEIVRDLLSAGAVATYVDADQKSLLHLAAAYAGADIVQSLLKAGADPMHPGNNGATPLHDAVWRRNAETIKALLPAYAAVNFSPDGRYNGFPIGMAISSGRLDIVRLFLDSGLNVNDKRFSSRPLLHQAAMENRPAVVKMLLEAGANRLRKDEQGKTAADYAVGEAAELLKK